jgi:HPt (histidine-containing phosphotransfer) domain-containing protein
MAKIFLSEAPEMMDLIAESMKTEDTEQIRLYAHRLKGSASHVAAGQLADKAYELECAAQAEDTSRAAEVFESVKPELDRVVSFFSADDWMETARAKAAESNVKQSC